MRPHLSILIAFLFVVATRAASFTAPADVPARLHWIGKTPAADRPVSFGIPFNKGEMKPTDNFTLRTDKGDVIAADFWPTAYWPDGSVKWGGFAAVVPGGTEGVVFERKEKKEKGKEGAGEQRTPGALSVSEAGGQFCINAGDLKAYISKSGNTIIDSLVLAGTKVAGHGQLVCTRQNAPYAEDVKEIRFSNYISQVEKVEVERAGNVRAVVKIEGNYMQDAGRWNLGGKTVERAESGPSV